MATENYSSWRMTQVRKGELYLVERVDREYMIVAGHEWNNGHGYFRPATPEEVAKKLAEVWRRMESRYGEEPRNAPVDELLWSIWFGPQPVPAAGNE